VLLADAVDTAEAFIDAFFYVYLILIFAYILTSWIPLPYNVWLNRIQRFLYDVVDPYLRIFRRFPGLNVGGLGLDLSPIIATLALIVVWRLIITGIEQLR
jgi:YggT family protein